MPADEPIQGGPPAGAQGPPQPRRTHQANTATLHIFRPAADYWNLAWSALRAERALPQYDDAGVDFLLPLNYVDDRQFEGVTPEMIAAEYGARMTKSLAGPCTCTSPTP